MKWKQTPTDNYQDWNVATEVPSAGTQWDLSLWDQSSICSKVPTVHVNSSVQSLVGELRPHRPCSVVKNYIMYIEHDFGIYSVQIAMMKTSRLTSKQNAFLSTENFSNKSSHLAQDQ